MNEFVQRFPNYDALDKHDTPSWNQVTRDAASGTAWPKWDGGDNCEIPASPKY